MRFWILTILALVLLAGKPVHAGGKIETNVTLSSYWVSNYKFYHSDTLVTVKGMMGNAWPDSNFEGKFRKDFLGPMTEKVDWQKVTKRELMSVRGMSWGMVDFGKGDGGPNKCWAWKVDAKGVKTAITGVWYLYVDRDIRPGTYPKIQLMPQTRPANWYRGYKLPYFQVNFPQMAADHTRYKIVANNGDFLPMGAVFRITKLGTNLHNVAAMNDYLNKQLFCVLDIGVGGRGMDVHQGLQMFEAEDINKYSLFMPGSTMKDTRGATIEIIGQLKSDGTFVYWDANGKPVKTGLPPKP